MTDTGIEWRDESFWSSAVAHGHTLRVLRVEEQGGAVLGWVAVVIEIPQPGDPHSQFKWSRQFDSRNLAKAAAERVLADRLSDNRELDRITALIAERMRLQAAEGARGGRA